MELIVDFEYKYDARKHYKETLTKIAPFFQQDPVWLILRFHDRTVKIPPSGFLRIKELLNNLLGKKTNISVAQIVDHLVENYPTPFAFYAAANAVIIENTFLSAAVASYECFPFIVNIYDNVFEKIYEVKIADSAQSFVSAAGVVADTILRENRAYSYDDIRSEILRYLETNDVLSATDAPPIVKEKYLTARVLGLDEIAPFLIDPYITEFFADGIHQFYYVDHRRFGRCRTTITFDSFANLLTRMKIEYRLPFDETMPSLKMNFQIVDVMLRVTLDIAPLATDRVVVDIRKASTQFLSLVDLIQLGGITSEVAAFLLMCYFLRANMAFVGPPYSGKTTLLNAITLATPPHWRVIAIEDAMEAIPLALFQKHQVRFLVEPVETGESTRNKSAEITKCLHRTPDVIYLGEIQTAEHSRAMFHAAAAGLQVVCTSHARDLQSMILRWEHHHKVPRDAIAEMDILTLLRLFDTAKGFKRKVWEVAEIQPDLSVKYFAQYDDREKTIKLVRPVSEIQFYKRSPFLPRLQPAQIERIYKNILEWLNKCVQDKVDGATFSQQAAEIYLQVIRDLTG